MPTCQKSDVNLVAWGEEADVEKDRLLERVCCILAVSDGARICGIYIVCVRNMLILLLLTIACSLYGLPRVSVSG